MKKLSKSLIPLFLVVPAFVAGCSKNNAGSGSTDTDSSGDDLPLVYNAKILFGADGFEDSISEIDHHVTLPPEETWLELSTKVDVRDVEEERAIENAVYSIAGTYDSSIVTLTSNTIHVEATTTLTLQTSFTISESSEVISFQFDVTFNVPLEQKMTYDFYSYEMMSNYDVGYHTYDYIGTPFNTTDDDTYFLAFTGSSGVMIQDGVQRIKKVTVNFKEVGDLDSLVTYVSKDNMIFQDVVGDINNQKYVDLGGGETDLIDGNKFVFEFNQEDFDPESYYYLKFWAYGGAENPAKIASIEVEFVAIPVYL